MLLLTLNFLMFLGAFYGTALQASKKNYAAACWAATCAFACLNLLLLRLT